MDLILIFFATFAETESASHVVYFCAGYPEGVKFRTLCQNPEGW